MHKLESFLEIEKYKFSGILKYKQFTYSRAEDQT